MGLVLVKEFALGGFRSCYNLLHKSTN